MIVTDLDQLTTQLFSLRPLKTIAFVSGSFDIIHIGHIQFFRFAKQQADLLVVGVDNDHTIRNGKGPDRPVHNVAIRMEVLSELRSIDFIFPILEVLPYDDPASGDIIYKKLLHTVNPDILISHEGADPFFKNKRKHAKELGIKFMDSIGEKEHSSTRLVAFRNNLNDN